MPADEEPRLSPELAGRLDRLEVLRGRERQVSALPGGLTNVNLKVVTDQGAYVVRCFASDVELLGIDRDAEHHDTGCAAAAGVGAPVVDYRPDLGLLVLGFLEGRTYDTTSFEENGVVPRVAQACRTLHGGPAFARDFDMFARQHRSRELLHRRDLWCPEGYDELADDFARARSALAVHAGPLVPCHNDLLAENFIDDGEKVWLIDYEYAGNNDASFELGNIATECELDASGVEELVASYDGAPTRRSLARTRLQALVSAYGWSLWGALQSASSDLDFDFRAWSRERSDKAARGFADPGFATLLEEAAGER